MTTVKIQHRRGSYTDFDPSQLDSAEIAVTLSNDPNASDGKAIYVGVGSGNVKQLATVEDMESAVETAVNGAISEVTDKVDEYIEEIETTGEEVLDSIPADYTTLSNDVDDLKSDLVDKGLSEDAKTALLDCFAHVAWTDAHGQDYYDALEEALYPDTGLVSISAVFTQGSAVIYPSTPLNDLKAYLVVTGYYGDTSTRVITDYTLSGTLEVGTSTITVTKEGKTTTFDVTVTVPYWDYEWYASSNILPDKMTGSYYDFTTEDGALYIENPSLDFGDEYTGDMRILIEGKLYAYNKETEQESYRNLPQVVIANGNAKGCKLIGSYGSASNNPNFYVAFGINNVNSLVDGVKGMDSHVYDIKSENGVHTLSVDGSAIPVTQNTGSSQWITKSCITSGTPESPLVYIMCIKHLAYKAL